MALGIGKAYFKLIGKKEYLRIPLNLLFINFFFQRILRVNCTIKDSVHFTSKVSGGRYFVYDDSVRVSLAVSSGVHITAFKDGIIEIGENTIFACNVCIQGVSHELKDKSNVYGKNVKIGDNCWIGNSATIVAGVSIGDNVTIGANSVVTKSFGSNLVLAGVPARIIKEL